MSIHQKGFSIIEGLLALVITCILVFVGWYVWQKQPNKKPVKAIDTFEACAAAGNPIMESYPEQCSVNGKIFTNPKQTPQEPPTE